MYVAMSRIRRFDTIKIYIGRNSLWTRRDDIIKKDPCITNVVYPKLIESVK